MTIIRQLHSLPGAHRRKGSTAVQKEFKVKTVYKHSGFTMQNLMHDIAVLELKGSAEISDKVSPVCLPTEEPSPGTECYITGKIKLLNLFFCVK